MKINVHAGHNPDGKIACGAVGILKESTEARNVKSYIVSMLKEQGHTVYDCTVDDGTSQTNVLTKIVKKCNAHSVDLDVSIHLNSGRNDMKGDGVTGGVEVLVYKGSTVKTTAANICKKVAALGFRNRGVKESTLYVLRKTTAPALLVECCFVDDADDAKLYDAKTMAAAIVEGITGEKVNTTTSSVNYLVKITCDALNIRKGAGTEYNVVGCIRDKKSYTIVEEKNGWGKLKSDAGWICLKYTKKV